MYLRFAVQIAGSDKHSYKHPAKWSPFGVAVNAKSCRLDGYIPQVIRSMVELSGIEPLTSSLRIQGATLDSEIPDDTK
jgi:hypothetical protein